MPRATLAEHKKRSSRAETPFGQFDGVSSISTHVLHAKLNVCPVKQTQHQLEQHRRLVRAGSSEFSKAKFLAFLQNVLGNFISSKAEGVEVEEEEEKVVETQRKSVAYILGRTQIELLRSSRGSTLQIGNSAEQRKMATAPSSEQQAASSVNVQSKLVILI